MLANTRSQTPSEADFESFDDLEVPDKETLITTIKKKLLFPSENSAEVKIDLEDAILSLEDLKNRYSLVLQAQSTPSRIFILTCSFVLESRGYCSRC